MRLGDATVRSGGLLAAGVRDCAPWQEAPPSSPRQPQESATAHPRQEAPPSSPRRGEGGRSEAEAG